MSRHPEDDVVCAIHQPNLFPRLSTLAKIFASDVWVVLDDVQLNRRDYQNRCRLAGPGNDERERWLTLPVHRPHGRSTTIRETRIVDPALDRRRTSLLLRQYYRHSPQWPTLATAIQPVLDSLDRTDRLADIAEVSTRVLLDLLGWGGVVHRSSDLPTRVGRSERLADLACAMGATTYLCGTGGATYLTIWPFASHGLDVRTFAAPTTSSGVWHAANRVTALRTLAVHDRDAVTRQLRMVGPRPQQRPPRKWRISTGAGPA